MLSIFYAEKFTEIIVQRNESVYTRRYFQFLLIVLVIFRYFVIKPSFEIIRQLVYFCKMFLRLLINTSDDFDAISEIRHVQRMFIYLYFNEVFIFLTSILWANFVSLKKRKNSNDSELVNFPMKQCLGTPPSFTPSRLVSNNKIYTVKKKKKYRLYIVSFLINNKTNLAIPFTRRTSSQRSNTQFLLKHTYSYIQ